MGERGQEQGGKVGVEGRQQKEGHKGAKATLSHQKHVGKNSPLPQGKEYRGHTHNAQTFMCRGEARKARGPPTASQAKEGGSTNNRVREGICGKKGKGGVESKEACLHKGRDTIHKAKVSQVCVLLKGKIQRQGGKARHRFFRKASFLR